MARITKKAINKALPQGYEIEGSIQEGYYYFFGDGEYGDTANWESSSVYTCKLSDDTVEGWVESFMLLADKNKERVERSKSYSENHIEGDPINVIRLRGFDEED